MQTVVHQGQADTTGVTSSPDLDRRPPAAARPSILPRMAAAFTTGAPTLSDTLFQRDLNGLIRQLRAAADPASAISRALSDSLREVLSSDADTKSVALLKLSYLHSIHHLPISPDAAFHALHLLPSPSPLRKRLAYLSAYLLFPALPDALLLSTNQLRKDLSSPSPHPPSLALELISLASSPDLARNLSADLLPLLSSPRASLRCRALAVVPRVLEQHPDWLRGALPRIADGLTQSDPRALSASISTIAELSARDPRPFLSLAPELHRILVDCRNNWVLIKILKVFSLLSPLEPRLGRRIVDPICEHLQRSSAKSLVFECVRVVFQQLSGFENAVRLAVEKLREFLVADDPNLRYLGLRGLSMLGPEYSWVVEECREVVFRALDDMDPNIQKEALNLVAGLVCNSNVVDICSLLAKQAARSDPIFANDILGAILATCGRNFYELVVDFEWYVSLLGEISRNPHCAKGEEIERQLVDIGMRVKDVRMELVHVARDLLIDPALLGNPFLYRILSAAAWIAGEYVEFSRNPVELVEALLQPRTSLLPTVVRSVYIHAVFKIIVFCYGSYLEALETNQLLSETDSNAKSQVPKCSDSLELDATTDHRLGEDTEAENSSTKANCHILDLSHINGQFSYPVITSILNMVKTAVLPLTESDEVGVQERSRNVLGLIQILQDFHTRDTIKESPAVSHTFEIVRLLQDSVSEEIKPVPVNAQERVPVPTDITFLDNLSDIGTILGNYDTEIVSTSRFSLRVPHSCDSREESEPSTESTSLLEEHRKRHGLYYLQVDKGETDYGEYPRANDMAVQGSAPTVSATEDLPKLSQKSMDHQRSKPVKSRPTVIKLDEENCPPISSVKSIEPKKDFWSGPLPDTIADGVDKHRSSKKKSSSRSSRRRDKETLVGSESTSETRQSLGDSGTINIRSKQLKHGKEKHKHAEKNAGVAGSTHSMLPDDSQLHHMQKLKQKADGPVDSNAQAPIQDFLL